ncbi:MAG TPA: DUF3501 family protein [Deltaproteobacteria bacterium]|nr:DUF3501 family protein [Deltaproteobacteria bacterium]
MKKVSRSEIVDHVTWADEVRPAVADEVMAAKRARRIGVGPHLTFLFENALTIRWQIQEMMRVERIVKESAIQHELDVYNGLLGDDGELGCVLMIEIEERSLRDRLLREWLRLPWEVYVELADGTRITPTFDEQQVGEGKLSSVQYLRFDTKGQVPVAIGCGLRGCEERTLLSDAAQDALAEDLASA